MRHRTLEELAAEGWVTEDWFTWQQGMCFTYARALIEMSPCLRLGMLMDGWHWFAHDGEYAWDSAGRHRLPYLGLGTPYDEMRDVMRCELDMKRCAREAESDYPGLLSDEDYVDSALLHIRRNNILAHQGV